MARPVIGFLLLLTTTALATAQSRVTGVVTIQEDSPAPAPVPDITVTAVGGSPERVLGSADTDAQGRYAIEGLPAGRVTLSIDTYDYYALTAGGVESFSIARSCPESGECPVTNFEVARSGLVEGWLTDRFGDPLQDFIIDVIPVEAGPAPQQPGRSGGRSPSARSDDRGYYRIWGLRPGRHKLMARDERMRSVGGPGVAAESEFVIPPGGGPAEANLTVRGEARTFTVSGRVAGLESAPNIGHGVIVESVGANGEFRRNARLRGEEFQIPSLAPGRYLFRLMSFGENGREMRLLDEVHVDRDIRDLVLTPGPPTGIHGRLVFVDSPPGPVVVRLQSSDRPSLRREQVRSKPPDYAFENGAVPPGRWDVELWGEYYLVEPISVNVAPGQMTEIEIPVSNQRSTVAGTAQLQGGQSREAASQFIVGLRGERGAQRMQADDEGRFEFEKVIPGQYRIAAWSRQDVDVESDEAWEEAGANSKTISVEPGFEVELDLTVTP